MIAKLKGSFGSSFFFTLFLCLPQNLIFPFLFFQRQIVLYYHNFQQVKVILPLRKLCSRLHRSIRCSAPLHTFNFRSLTLKIALDPFFFALFGKKEKKYVSVLLVHDSTVNLRFPKLACHSPKILYDTYKEQKRRLICFQP